jgi:hypothetical protein
MSILSNRNSSVDLVRKLARRISLSEEDAKNYCNGLGQPVSKLAVSGQALPPPKEANGKLIFPAG